MTRKMGKLALACVVGIVVGTFGLELIPAARTGSVSSRGSLAQRTTPMPLDWSRTQTVTVGNVADEISSVTIYTTTTAVAVWCTGENCMVNWWSTLQSDLGSTNALPVAKDREAIFFDRYIFGVAAADSPVWSSTSVVLWFASASATSSVVRLVEFTENTTE